MVDAEGDIVRTLDGYGCPCGGEVEWDEVTVRWGAQGHCPECKKDFNAYIHTWEVLIDPDS